MNTLFPDEIMALTIYGEARGESVEGQIAVANVIFNRWKDNPKKYKSVKDVCLEPKQFSCWNENDPNRDKLLALGEDIDKNKELDKVMQQCIYIARGVIGCKLLDNTKGSKYYITKSLWDNSRPLWAKTPITKPLSIGNNNFFNV